MSEFSEAIKEEIKRSGQTLLYLSDASGLSLDHIAKMRQGKRLPQNTEKVRKLLLALQCTENTYNNLFSLYKIERLGSEEWSCMLEIKKMLEYKSGFLSVNQGRNIHAEDTDMEYLQNIRVLHSRTEIITILHRVLSQSGSTLRMSTEELPETLVDMLAQRLNRQEFRLEHIFLLKKIREQGGSLYNLQYINQIMPLIRSGGEYIPSYEYEEKGNALLSNFIIADKWALMLGKDMESGLIVWDEESISYLKEIFECKKKTKRHLLRFFSDINQWAGFIAQNRSRYLAEHEGVSFRPLEAKNYYLEYDPCLMRHLTQDMLERHLIVEDTGKQMIIDNWRLRITQLEKEKAVHIFTKDGLKYTTLTGRLAEIPSSVYTPLTIKERLEVMKSYLRWVEQRYGEVYMLDDSQFSLQKGSFVYSTVSMVDNEITFCTGTDGAAYCSIYEQGIAEKINHFCHILEEGEMVCTKEECVQFIRSQIDWLESKLKEE